MNAHLFAAAAALASLVFVPVSASADEAEPSWAQQDVAAPSQAFELAVASGYTQPFGLLRSGLGMPDVAKAGLGVDIAGGYRVDPHWGVSLGGQYQQLDAQNADASRGAALTLAAQYHLVPQTRVDPWVEVGTGYRMLWQVPGGESATVLSHGVEHARVRAGVDLRLTPDVAIAPVIGADATMFLFQDVAGNNSVISDPRLSTFVFAGLQGRLDVGGTKVATLHTTSADTELR